MTDAKPTPSEKAATTTPKTDADAKSFLNRAQEKVGGAVDTTVGAVKEHPVAAAAIAGGVAAAAAGAAYGISKLGGKDTPVPKGGSKSKS